MTEINNGLKHMIQLYASYKRPTESKKTEKDIPSKY